MARRRTEKELYMRGVRRRRRRRRRRLRRTEEEDV